MDTPPAFCVTVFASAQVGRLRLVFGVPQVRKFECGKKSAHYP